MTADFSLTSPEPLPGRDANVFAAVPGRSYETIALTCWLDVQHSALDIDDIDAALIATGERIQRGDAWVKQHGRQHPRYLEAITLQSELENRRRSQLIQLRCAAYTCWVHCMELYAALQCVDDRADWIHEHARCRFTGDSPQGIWRSVRGKQRPPGAWPPHHSEQWIERRLGQVEIWNMEMLRERLYERQEAGS